MEGNAVSALPLSGCYFLSIPTEYQTFRRVCVCLCVQINHPIVLHIPYCPLSLDMIVCSNNNNDDLDLV